MGTESADDETEHLSLQPATADREEWVNTTPTNAGRTLFGPTDRDFEE